MMLMMQSRSESYLNRVLSNDNEISRVTRKIELHRRMYAEYQDENSTHLRR